MTKITLKGNQIKTIGKLPKVGKKAPKFKLVKTDLSTARLKDFKGKKVLINITPSIDTGICANSLRKFNEEAAGLDNTVVLHVIKGPSVCSFSLLCCRRNRECDSHYQIF